MAEHETELASSQRSLSQRSPPLQSQSQSQSLSQKSLSQKSLSQKSLSQKSLSQRSSSPRGHSPLGLSPRSLSSGPAPGPEAEEPPPLAPQRRSFLSGLAAGALGYLLLLGSLSGFGSPSVAPPAEPLRRQGQEEGGPHSAPSEGQWPGSNATQVPGRVDPGPGTQPGTQAAPSWDSQDGAAGSALLLLRRHVALVPLVQGVAAQGDRRWGRAGAALHRSGSSIVMQSDEWHRARDCFPDQALRSEIDTCLGVLRGMDLVNGHLLSGHPPHDRDCP